MGRRKITIVDICAVTGYSRDQVHGLLKKIPLYAEYPGSPRVARNFTRHDLLVLSVAIRLEIKHGLQRSFVVAVVDKIHAELSIPRATKLSPLLHISIDPPSVTYLTEKGIEKEGTIVALEPVFKQIDDYLNGDSAENNPQPTLPFGPSLAIQRKRG